VLELGRRHFLGLLAGTAAGISSAFPAEQKEIPTIGFLSARAREESRDLTAAFIRGLEVDGIALGRNVGIEYRWADLQYERLPVLQPTRLEMVINLKTAAALGLAVPTMLLASADELID